MPDRDENEVGMSAGVNGIPLVPDETGNVPTPFPYLNDDSAAWQIGDEDSDDEDGYDEGGSAMARLLPPDPDEGGGDEVDPEDEDDEPHTGFGIGAFLFAQPPLQMA